MTNLPSLSSGNSLQSSCTFHVHIKQYYFKDSPNYKLTHCWNCCWCPSVLAPGCTELTLQRWPFLIVTGEEKGGREGEKKGKKREYLDKLTEQICRHPPLFFNRTSSLFLPPPTYTHLHTNTSPSRNLGKLVASSPAKESCLLYLSIIPLEMPCTEVIKEGGQHESRRTGDAIATGMCRTSVADKILANQAVKPDLIFQHFFKDRHIWWDLNVKHKHVSPAVLFIGRHCMQHKNSLAAFLIANNFSLRKVQCKSNLALRVCLTQV